MKRRISMFLTLMVVTPAIWAQTNLTLRGQVSYAPDVLNDIWGYEDSLGNEYALVGKNLGVSIVDVTDPDNPIELFAISGPGSVWREIRVWKEYAYAVHDVLTDTTDTAAGLLIIDLRNLPNSIDTIPWTGGPLDLATAHNLHIDENGFAYIFGFNNFAGTIPEHEQGALILDLADPLNPVHVGTYDQGYVHDGFIRGDTLWAAQVLEGWFSVVDVSDKANPNILATHNTSFDFTHNVWLSDDGNYLFTTDELSGAFVGSYDVSDLSNITELDTYQSPYSFGVIPHNTFFINNFLVTSYYRDGVIILDATYPDNLVEVGHYDTSPLQGDGYNGCWGVYPYLSSGNLLATDMEEGLHIFTPNYQQACYLVGSINDSLCGDPLIGVTITIVGGGVSTQTDLTGHYKTGTVDAGVYDIEFAKAGYMTRTIPNVNLQNGQLTQLDINLFSPDIVQLNGIINDSSQNPLIDATVLITNPQQTYHFTTDSAGAFFKCNVIPATYDIFAGSWGSITAHYPDTMIGPASSNLNLSLEGGYKDDFILDLGWTVSGSANAGIWERGKPEGTTFQGSLSNPASDNGNDLGDLCYVTGNAGGQAGNDDVDDGNTRLISPEMDLSGYKHPRISYDYWFFNRGGAGGAPDDALTVTLTNGTDSMLVATYEDNGIGSASWHSETIVVEEHISTDSPLRIIFETADDPATGHLVEAAIDVFRVTDSTETISTAVISDETIPFRVTPNPFFGETTIRIAADRTLDLSVHNLLGERVLAYPVNAGKSTVNIGSSLDPGLYLITIKDRQKPLTTFKVIKMR